MDAIFAEYEKAMTSSVLLVGRRSPWQAFSNRLRSSHSSDKHQRIPVHFLKDFFKQSSLCASCALAVPATSITTSLRIYKLVLVCEKFNWTRTRNGTSTHLRLPVRVSAGLLGLSRSHWMNAKKNKTKQLSHSISVNNGQEKISIGLYRSMNISKQVRGMWNPWEADSAERPLVRFLVCRHCLTEQCQDCPLKCVSFLQRSTDGKNMKLVVASVESVLLQIAAPPASSDGELIA